jgi:hypothetical protein
MKNLLSTFTVITFPLLMTSCGGSDAENNLKADCDSTANYIFQELDSLLLIEFEDGNFGDSTLWSVKNDNTTSGGKYGVWTGPSLFNKPGESTVTFQLNIQNTGTFRFIWKSAVTIGDNGTESNDSWLRFADASDFYGEKNGERIYPNGTGKSPNPEGASKDGWFKIYRSGNDLDFKWQARTSDNDAHDVYVKFDNPGIYTMEASGRSPGHAIDQFLMYQEAQYSNNEATSSTDFSEINCE